MEHFTVLSQRSKHNEHFFVTLNLTRNTHTHTYICALACTGTCAHREKEQIKGEKKSWSIYVNQLQ